MLLTEIADRKRFIEITMKSLTDIYQLRAELIDAYLYKRLSDYIWFNFFSTHMYFLSSNIFIGGQPQYIFPR